MKRKVALSIITLALTLPINVLAATTPKSANNISQTNANQLFKGDLAYEITEVSYRKFRFTVRNESSKKLELKFPTTQTFDYKILNGNGEVYYEYSKDGIFMDVPSGKLLNPQESYRVDLDLTEPLSKIKSGNYKLEVWLTSSNTVNKILSIEIDVTKSPGSGSYTIADNEDTSADLGWEGFMGEGNNEEMPFDVVGSYDTNIALANELVTIIYKEDLRKSITYVYKGTELRPLEVLADKIKVQLYDTIGYVRKEDISLVPSVQLKGRSYYSVKQGNLVHYIYSHEKDKYTSYIYGPALEGLQEGVKYYSWNGIDFENGVVGYNYFNYVPLNIPTAYTAEELNAYIQAVKPDSPLNGTGKYFKEAEEEYGVNAMYLLSHAIHESSWGKSRIAKDKKNLFGINAVDSDAYGKASEYASFKESIDYAAYFIKTRYLESLEKTPFYRGAVLGNKGVGMNIYYASDPYWGQKIAGRMYSIDKFLGGKDWGKHRLGLPVVDGLNVRTNPKTDSPVQYRYNKNYGLVILEELNINNEVWYKVKSDHPKYQEAYVYGKGDKGLFVKEIMKSSP